MDAIESVVEEAGVEENVGDVPGRLRSLFSPKARARRAVAPTVPATESTDDAVIPLPETERPPEAEVAVSPDAAVRPRVRLLVDLVGVEPVAPRTHSSLRPDGYVLISDQLAVYATSLDGHVAPGVEVELESPPVPIEPVETTEVAS